ncbi:MAG TPA: bacteriohopanetetrol glucosamine biosynthesis glycosyltransferase HpnI [Candidatus Saccharimonadales bacterium]|nr:bacteriohopanetetrol glucosamine biosynthesis glycosyltransferase HpnI [Candidatus Saccharimonadales bacterium]
MLKIVVQLVAYLFALLALCGLGYLLLSLWSEWRYLLRRNAARARTTGTFTPPVSILKPLRGTDRQMYESFRSHCLQDYPQYEIIFGVNDASDEAVAEVERLQREFPMHDIRLIVCSEVRGSNRKVSNLSQMMLEAKFEHIVVNDSDIRVGTDYLRRIAAPMEDERVGLVTALYRAEAGRSVASRMEAVTIATDFAGGVLCAMELEGGLHFGLGSTLAFTRSAAEAIGGLSALLDYLADDHELGRMISDAGYKVALSEVVVETFLPEYSFSAMFEHQLRWARTVRDLRKFGYIGVLLTFGLPWAIASALFAGWAGWSLVLLAAVAIARFASGYLLCGPILNDRQTLQDLWLIPARDVVGVAIWFASFGGDTIVWRGERFHLKDGKLTRA